MAIVKLCYCWRFVGIRRIPEADIMVSRIVAIDDNEMIASVIGFS